MSFATGRSWAVGLISVYLLGMTSLSKKLSLALILAFWLATGGTRWCYLAVHTIPRDLRLLGSEQHFSKKNCFRTTPHLTILLKDFSSLRLTPHHYFSSAPEPHIRIALKTQVFST